MQEPGGKFRKCHVVAALCVSTALAGTPVISAAAELPLPRMIEVGPSEGMRAGLRIDTEDLGGAGEPVQAKIEETAVGTFDGEGFTRSEDPEDPVIVVVVERTGTEENPGFVVGYSIEKGDEIVAGSARQSDCSLCTRTELISRIEGELPGLLELAREHQVEAIGDDGGDGDAGDGDGGDGDGGDGDAGAVKKIGPMGFAGIGLAVVGVAGVGAGVGLAVKGFEPVDDQRLDLTDYRTPGNVVLVIGGAALIAGVVMIALDVTKRKKQRAKSQSAARPRVEPRGTGIAF